MLVAIKDIRPNPFRHLERYPIIKEKVETLRRSIRTTGFWNNVIGRQINGAVEIAYGHHRREALKLEFGPDHEVELQISDFSDADMLRIMANENMEEWHHNAAIEHETIRAVVEAFAEGKIELKTMAALGPSKARIAPLYATIPVAGRDRQDTRKWYSTKTVSEFLDWERTKVELSLAALELIEQDIATDEQFDGLSGRQAKKLIRGLHETLRAGETAARVSGNPEKARRRAKFVATQTARELAADIKNGNLADDAITDRAREIRYDTRGKQMPDIDSFARSLTSKLTSLLAYDAMSKELAKLVEHAEHLDDEAAHELVMALKGLAARATENAAAVEKKVATLPPKTPLLTKGSDNVETQHA